MYILYEVIYVKKNFVNCTHYIGICQEFAHRRNKAEGIEQAILLEFKHGD